MDILSTDHDRRLTESLLLSSRSFVVENESTWNLWCAVQEKDIFRVKLAIQNGGDVNWVNDDHEGGWTPLQNAATLHSKEIVELLLQAPHVNVNYQNTKVINILYVIVSI